MAVTIEETVLNALRGQLSENTRLPAPRLIKIYISSLKREFREERRILLEVIGPELQSLYDDRQIEVELVDMHFGTGPTEDEEGNNEDDCNPFVLEDHLVDLAECKKFSKSIFFITLVGTEIGNLIPPADMDSSTYDAIRAGCTSQEEINLLENCYKKEAIPSSLSLCAENGRKSEEKYVLSADYRADNRQWLKTCNKLRMLFERIQQQLHLSRNSSSEDSEVDSQRPIDCAFQSRLQREIKCALELSNDHIIAVFREWQGPTTCDNSVTDKDDRRRIRDSIKGIKNQLSRRLSSRNLIHISINGDQSRNRDIIDSEDEKVEEYLAKFKSTLIERLAAAIESDLQNDPDCAKGRKKTVQEIFHEHSTHLMFLKEHQRMDCLLPEGREDAVNKMRSAVIKNNRSSVRHSPHFICGSHGSGKSALLVELYEECSTWFAPNINVHRIIRFAAATPRSSYNLELLRVICQQISIIYNIPEGYLPKDASFDPLYINNWFQNLLRRCEDLPNEVLFLFIDDLHKLNPLDCDIVTALSWLPISLPTNVFLVCSTTIPIEQLKLSPIQKERFKNPENLLDLSQYGGPLVKLFRGGVDGGGEGTTGSGETFQQFVEGQFEGLEKRFGRKGMSRLATYLTCSEYGLTETELLELLMPTQNCEALLNTEEGCFNFSTFRSIRNQMKPLIREKLMSGKVLIQWRHSLCAEVAKLRYIPSREVCRQAHAELANIFFVGEANEDTDEVTSSHSGGGGVANTPPDVISGPRPSNAAPWADVSYSVRHVEESWHHLMRSEDTDKLKTIAVCNFDFLLAAVQTVSISYLRCLLEHVRCHILDRDIELIYYTIRKSSDVLTRDPMQLGAQLIAWLRPIMEHDENDNSLLSITVRSATAWCDGYTVPLLVPLTGWLPVPLPSQIRTMTVTGTGPIRFISVAPTKQHLIISPRTGDVQMWHIMNNCLVHTFKGHSAPVTCIVVPPKSHYLITGSADNTVVVWDTRSFTMKQRIRQHIAPVSCVTSALENSIVISGSDDSSIIISSLETGKLVMKIDHHRAKVSGINVNQASDVLISASHDATICLWSLEDYALLNCIQMAGPVIDFRISVDSVFLLALCEDNGLYLRALATGTELHCLKGHKSKVRGMCLATDGQRAIVGCEDTRALIFDMHSGRLIRSLPPNPGAVTAVQCMENDDFLITAGGNKITFYSFRNEDSFAHLRPKKNRLAKHIMSHRQQFNMSNIPITCFHIARDSQMAAVASGKTVSIWQLNTPEQTTTLDGHTSIVTALSFSPNSEFVASGSEDKTVIVWGLTLSLIVTTFKGHNSAITCVVALMDSRRIISADKDGLLCVWLADSATLLQTVQGPHKSLAVTNNMKFAACSNGDNSLRIWSLTREDEKYNVSHSDEITCFVITVDSLYIITGSRDMSLKVWQATGGKLAQVLVGHTDAVTCVAVSVTNKTHVLSGSKDSNLIMWDLLTGEEIHTLAGHLGPVTCIKISADGTTAVSASDDKTLIVWETKRGLALTSLQLHIPFSKFDVSMDCSRILVHLGDSPNFPIICLHNTPASYIKLPTYSAPARDVEDLRPAGPKRQTPKRLLKKEVSLDTYTWQRKYGHLTSSVMMAQVDERLKRRFSVSASMEEISKITESKTVPSQANIGPEQAALAQSQHFDQLEALWNKRSPPRRRLNTSMSRQSSLVEDRISSDEDEFQEERSGGIHSTARVPTELDLIREILVQKSSSADSRLNNKPEALKLESDKDAKDDDDSRVISEFLSSNSLEEGRAEVNSNLPKATRTKGTKFKLRSCIIQSCLLH